MSREPRPHTELLLTVLFWGGNFSAVKLALPFLPPLAFTALRFAVGTLLLWVVFRRLEPGHRLPPRLRWPMLGLGLVGNTLYQLFFISGLARTSATSTALILSAMPVMVTVGAAWLGMEVISGRQRLAVVLGTLGVLVVVGARGRMLDGGDWRGDLLVLAAVACWSAYTLGLRRLGPAVSPLGATAWAMLTGTPALVLLGLPSLATVAWGQVPAAAWAGLVYSTLLSLVAAYLLWTRGVQRIGPSRAALYTCLTPLVAAAVAAALLGERPTAWHAAGGLLIVGGVLLGNVPAGRPVPAEG